MSRYGDFEVGFSLSDIIDQFEVEDVRQLMARFDLVGEDDAVFKHKYEQLIWKLRDLHRSALSDTPEFFKRNLEEFFGDVLDVNTR